MYPETKCFWIEPTDMQQRFARVYQMNNQLVCTANPKFKYHNAMNLFDVIPCEFTEDGMLEAPPHLSPRSPIVPWPTECACGFVFDKDDPTLHFQTFNERIYVRGDNGAETTIRDAGPGAVWDAWWMGQPWKNADGLFLTAICPNGRHWDIDGRASNCTLPNDGAHRCWVRHGDPRRDITTLTVDKDGLTCQAGAGSIQAGDYHGFLRNGVFTAG